MSDHILEAAQPTIGNIPPQARPDTGTGIMPNWWASPDDPVWKSLPVTHPNLSLRHLPVPPPQCVLSLDRPAHQ